MCIGRSDLMVSRSKTYASQDSNKSHRATGEFNWSRSPTNRRLPCARPTPLEDHSGPMATPTGRPFSHSPVQHISTQRSIFLVPTHLDSCPHAICFLPFLLMLLRGLDSNTFAPQTKDVTIIRIVIDGDGRRSCTQNVQGL